MKWASYSLNALDPYQIKYSSAANNITNIMAKVTENRTPSIRHRSLQLYISRRSLNSQRYINKQNCLFIQLDIFIRFMKNGSILIEFFENAANDAVEINSEKNWNMLQEFIWHQLKDMTPKLRLQQENRWSHLQRSFRRGKCQTIGDQLVGEILQFNPCLLFLWRYIKSKVYNSKPNLLLK